MLFWRRTSPPSVESRTARSRNRQDRKSVRDRHFGPYDIVDKSDLNSFTPLRILFARTTTRAYPYFSSFHLAKEAILAVTSPVRSRPNEVEARSALNLCRSTWLELAPGTAEIGPLASHYCHVEGGFGGIESIVT